VGEVRDRRGSQDARFIKVPVPTDAELKRLLEIVRRKVLRRFVRIGVIPQEVADQMLSWGNSGFSLHADTWVRGADRIWPAMMPNGRKACAANSGWSRSPSS